jgi:mannose-6-phosphate isomerase-like protein (cupin superfamily)
MNYQAINFGKKLGLFDEQWQPKVIAEMNDYQFKVVKLQGDFIWHDHKNTDETFIVLEGVFATERSNCRRAKCSSSGRASNTSPMPNTRLNYC